MQVASQTAAYFFQGKTWPAIIHLVAACTPSVCTQDICTLGFVSRLRVPVNAEVLY